MLFRSAWAARAAAPASASARVLPPLRPAPLLPAPPAHARSRYTDRSGYTHFGRPGPLAALTATGPGGPGEGGGPGGDEDKPYDDGEGSTAPASVNLQASESVTLHVAQCLVKRLNPSKDDKGVVSHAWASFDPGELRLIADAASGRSRLVYTTSAPRALVNVGLSSHTVVGAVEDAGTGGKAKLQFSLLEREGLRRYIVVTKTRDVAKDIAAGLLAGSGKKPAKA